MDIHYPAFLTTTLSIIIGSNFLAIKFALILKLNWEGS